MTGAVALPAGSLRPDPAAVLEALGVPPGRTPGASVGAVLERAFALFESTADARALVCPVDAGTFAEIYRGEGRNEPDTPLDHVLPGAEALALFVVTLGPEVTEEVGRQTSARDLLVAAALDAIASLAAEGAVQLLEGRFADRLEAAGSAARRPAVLAYSPGYCGWHLSGQRRLLAALAPERIGVRLSPSDLMLPLKSVSGVLVAGEAGIHDLGPGFAFCASCATVTCRLRVDRLRPAPRR